MSRWVNTDFAKGSNVCVAGGTLVEGRGANVVLGAVLVDLFNVVDMTPKACEATRVNTLDSGNAVVVHPLTSITLEDLRRYVFQHIYLG